MNYIDIAFIVICVLMIIVGTCRGLAVSVINLIRAVVGIPLAFFVGNNYSDLVYKQFVREHIYNSVVSKIDSSKANEITTYINDLSKSIPNDIIKSFDISSVNGLTSSKAADKITDTLIEPFAIFLVKVAIIIAVLVVFYLLTAIIILIIKKAQRKKNAPLKRTNMVFGGLFAAVKAAIIVIAVSVIFAYAKSYLNSSDSLYKAIDGSQIINFVNSFDLISKFK